MRRMLMAAAAVCALTASTSLWAPAAQAREWPWCAVIMDRTGSATNCGFVSKPQCEEYLSGMAGYCERNPFYGREPYRRGYRDDR